MGRRRMTTGISALAGVLTLAALPASAGAATPGSARAAGTAQAALPPVSPTPRSLGRTGAGTPVTPRVTVVADDATDRPARDRLIRELKAHGARHIAQETPDQSPDRGPGTLTVRLGPAQRPDIARALGDTTVPDQAEGYALRVGNGQIALGGTDGAGQFYAVQTLRQLLQRQGAHWQVAGAQVSDHPSMPLRGTIEGFYGEPWTQAERLDQMDFHGDIKANTYVYAPKDDPYHRDKWRDPYPADKLDELGTLVRRATANHVRFTFAVSPGTSICYSDPDDRKALIAKLQSLYDLGTRAFSIPLDDISYTKWNCAGDEQAYGAPGRASAAKAQVDLLNTLQRDFVATHEGTRPLQMVPTEYGNLTDTEYKKILRDSLDPAVVVMWTGTAVVPPSITVEQADAASRLFGRKVFVWDNYPVNDYGNTSGRLLLAPYDHREAGLAAHLSGIVANPMNQPYASKIAVFGAADFTWNDTAYDAGTDWPRALAYLAGGDRDATDALGVFADLEHLAPTFGETPWQPQAPELTRRVSEFWDKWDAGEQNGALRDLRAYAQRIAAAPATIRAGAVQPGFVTDAAPWLDATALWGRATVTTLDALAAHHAGKTEQARTLLGTSEDLQTQARAVRTEPARNKWGSVQPKIGDGVLDTFLADAAGRITG
ncbi:beta-N-acetylglucosaminidase domain-containing protein [Streptomyces sp. NPDC058045]|uniref:beta-N-acetylhexosaminidase family protein n=1 Tax=Streptomyces sp. NPDC058045 TaxID=3346311 RepID=UPI0036EBAD30